MDALAPEPRPQARFAHYIFERRLNLREVASDLRCSHEHVRRICLPYDDPAWLRPSLRMKQKIAAWTRGDVGLEDWAEPQRVAA